MVKVILIIAAVFVVFIAGVALYTLDTDVQNTVDTISSQADSLMNQADVMISDVSEKTTVAKATYEGFSPRTKSGLFVAILALISGVVVSSLQKIVALVFWLPSSFGIFSFYEGESYAIVLGIIWLILFGVAGLVATKLK